MKTTFYFFSTALFFRRFFKIALAIFMALFWANPAGAQLEGIGPPEPYVAEPYVPPPPRVSKVHLVDNGDGTLSDEDSDLMWAKADSYADLGRCLNWRQSHEYAKNLRLGNHDDWRMPSLDDLFLIYDNTKENVKGWDRDPNNPLALDEKFADGAAYWYWSSDYDETKLFDCCARAFYFVTGIINVRRFGYCDNGGVRPVRKER